MKDKGYNFAQSVTLVFLLWGIAMGGVAQTADNPELDQLLASGKSHQHPLGFTFRYPPGWTVQEAEGGLSLIPPDVAGEIYLITTEGVQNISRPDAPQMIQIIEGQISALIPFLERSGEVKQIQTDNGPGAQLTWNGKNPLTGVEIRAYVYVTLFKEQAVYLVAAGGTDRVQANQRMLGAIFSTFGTSGGKTEASPSSSPLNPLGGGNPLAALDPYAGTFKNEQMQLALSGNNGEYTGTIDFDGQQFPTTAKNVDGTLQGTFASQGNSFAFTASLKDTTLTFTTSGTTYILKKQIANPLVAPQSANPLSATHATSSPGVNRKNWNTYRHPIGFTFAYPAEWKVQDTEVGLNLSPPDVSSNAQGPTEVYLVASESVGQEISRPDDPRLIQYLDSQLRSMLPFLRRTGEVEPIKGDSGPGALITWEGKNPAGMNVRARVFATLIKGYGVALTALGDTDRIKAREPILREIFSTLGFAESEKDSRLIGTWRHESFYSSGEFSSTSVRYMVFQPDGTFSSSSRLMAGTSGVSADTGENPGERGRWSAGNKKIRLVWDDGSYAEYGYYVEGQPGSQEMLFKPTDGGKNQLWTQVR